MGQWPAHIEAEYRRAIKRRVRIVRKFTDAAIKRYIGTRLDDSEEDRVVREVSRVLSGVGVAVEGRWTPQDDRELVERTAKQLELFQTRQVAGELSALLGIDPVLSNDTVRRQMDQWIAKNLELVKNVGPKFVDTLQQKFAMAIREGVRAEDFTQVIIDATKIERSRATLIARNELGNLTAQITQQRQLDLGVTHYRWISQRDERVRESHEDYDGQVFTWASGSPEGHPGEPINCRCFAEPIINRN